MIGRHGSPGNAAMHLRRQRQVNTLSGFRFAVNAACPEDAHRINVTPEVGFGRATGDDINNARAGLRFAHT
jgi:hypothetical protein